MKAVISAPARYHMFELGQELLDRGMLAALMTGYPRFKLKGEKEIGPYLRTFPHFHLAYRLALAVAKRELDYADRTVFDWLTSRNLPKCDVFMGIAASTLWTGRAAKSHGAAYIVDRPCSHIEYQDRIIQEEAMYEGVKITPIDPRIVQREVQEYAEADLVTVPSKFAYESFLHEGFPAEKLRLIPYGVDTTKFRPSGDPDPDWFDVLHVGLCSLRKGIPHLLRAFHNVKHPRKRLTLVGSIVPEMEAMIGRFSRLHPVRTTGHLPQDQLSEHMSRSHVLVLASVEDGYGLVMSQAMACGTPVVASRNTGADMLITEGVDGLMFDVRDDEALIHHLQTLADNPDLRATMRRNALDKAQSLQGWKTYGDAVVSMFQEVRG